MGKARVIVTYGWCRVSYAALRCLAAHNVDVVVGGPDKFSMAGSSKFAHATFTYPSPYTDPIGFMGAVADAAKLYDASVYLPIHEEILAVAKYQHLLPDSLLVPIATHDQIMTAYDKGLTMAHAEKVGVPIPQTIYPDSVEQVAELASGVIFPTWIKLKKSNSAKGVFKIDDLESLIKRYAEIVEEFSLDADSLPLIQQHISGKVYAVSMLFNKGKMVSKFVRKNIREKTHGGGTCTKCVSVRVPTLENHAQKMLETLNWHGPAMLEFKYDEDNDAAYLLEINPRYHGTIDHDIPVSYTHLRAHET